MMRRVWPLLCVCVRVWVCVCGGGGAEKGISSAVYGERRGKEHSGEEKASDSAHPATHCRWLASSTTMTLSCGRTRALAFSNASTASPSIHVMRGCDVKGCKIE